MFGVSVSVWLLLFVWGVGLFGGSKTAALSLRGFHLLELLAGLSSIAQDRRASQEEQEESRPVQTLHPRRLDAWEKCEANDLRSDLRSLKKA